MPTRLTFPAVEDLIMWRDIKKTGMVFGGITLVYLLFEWSGLSLMTIVANILLAVTLGCLAWAFVGNLLGRYVLAISTDKVPAYVFMQHCFAALASSINDPWPSCVSNIARLWSSLTFLQRARTSA